MANGTLAASQIEMLSLSGTGIITITPPATNTNRAITLPDAAGAIVVSGTTPSLNGIAFPATQSASADANTLDDYEEGTWTPTQGAGLTVIGTFSSAGFYTKIGRQVTVIGRVGATTSVAATANNILCAGLPFTSAAQVSIGASTNSALSQVGAAYIEAGTSVYSTAMTAATNIFFTVTYFV